MTCRCSFALAMKVTSSPTMIGWRNITWSTDRGDDVTDRVTAAACVGHLVEQAQDRAAMDLARKVGHLGVINTVMVSWCAGRSIFIFLIYCGRPRAGQGLRSGARLGHPPREWW